MKKLSFSIPSSKPQSKPESVNILDDSSTAQNDGDVPNHLIAEFDPSKPATPSAPKTIIPPLQNQWKPFRSDGEPQQDDEHSAAPWRRAPAETERLRKLKLKDDLRRLPEDQGFEEFNKDVPVEGFGAALLAGYGWAEGMGIGKNAREDVKVVQLKPRTAGEGLGFVRDAPGAPVAPCNNGNLDQCSHDLCHLQL
ncbi:MOS2 protein [Spatholobus suberectus]|nr:MOS2 protein [Spatholobus suberectus]